MRIYTRRPLKDRLLEKYVPAEDGCWNWTGTKNINGYGMINPGGRSHTKVFAHRASWEIHNDKEIPKGMVVMHSCDNRKCINPDHLAVGTQSDNLLDMSIKGRGRRRVSADSTLKENDER